jgi:diaminopimelate epimerase
VDDLENYNVKNKAPPLDTVSYTESKEVILKKIDANTFRCAPMKEAWKMKHWLVERVRPLLLAMNATGVTDATSIDLNVEGGKLVVSFDKRKSIYECYLKGP